MKGDAMDDPAWSDDDDMGAWREHGVAATMRGIREQDVIWSETMNRCMMPEQSESGILDIGCFASEYRDCGGMTLVEAAASICLVPRLLGTDRRQEGDRMAGIIYTIDSMIKESGMDGFSYEEMMLAILGCTLDRELLYDDYLSTTGNIETGADFRMNEETAGDMLDAVPEAVDMISGVDGLKADAMRAAAAGYPIIGPAEATSMLAVAITLGLDHATVPSAADIARICTLRGDPRPIPGWRDDDGMAWGRTMITLAMYQDVRNTELTRGALSALLDRDDPFSMDGADTGEAAMTVLEALRMVPYENSPVTFLSGDGQLGRRVHRITADLMSPALASGGMSPATGAAAIRMSSIIQRHEPAFLPLVEDRGITRVDPDVMRSILVDALDMDADGLPSGFIRETLMDAIGDAK